MSEQEIAWLKSVVSEMTRVADGNFARLEAAWRRNNRLRKHLLEIRRIRRGKAAAIAKEALDEDAQHGHR